MSRIIALSVAMYLAAVAAISALAWATNSAALVDPVPGYRLSVAWVLPSTSQDRRGALDAAGRPEIAATYHQVERASWTLLALMVGVGAVIGLRSQDARRLPRREVLLVAIFFPLLLLLAGQMTTLAHALEELGAPPPGGFNASPAYWLATTVLSAAIMGRYAAWLAHDAAVWLRETGLIPSQPIAPEPPAL